MKAATTNNPTTAQGLNLHLPEAHLKEEKGLTKLSFYEQSEKDSLKLGAQAANDPFYTAGLSKDSTSSHVFPHSAYSYDPTPPLGTYHRHPSEEKIYQKLNELNAVMNQSPSLKNNYSMNNDTYQPPLVNHSLEAMELEKTLHPLGNRESASSDTELEQLNQMMDKILVIQHPKQAKQPEQEALSTHRAPVIPVAIPSNACTISLLSDTGILSSETTTTPDSTIAFCSFSEVPPTAGIENTIPATVAETQTLISGSVVKFRLLQNIFLQQHVIPKGTFIYGIATINNERLTIQINALHYGNAIFPVRLEVYDLDGLEGIYVPGSLTRDVAKQTSDNALQSIELTTLDRSVATQAASAGIQAAKSLLSRKARQIEVTLKAGYQVLLLNKQS